MTPLERRTLQVAKRKVGEREATGRNDGPFPRFLQRWAAGGAAWLEGQPWCVMFVTWCAHRAANELRSSGVEVTLRLPVCASSSTLWAWAGRHNARLAYPTPGCIGLAKGGPTGHYHAFLVHDVDGSRLITVEGNYRNAVGWNERRREDCDYVRVA